MNSRERTGPDPSGQSQVASKFIRWLVLGIILVNIVLIIWALG